jgi:glycerophosphoryl diester phosphodiesterase
MYRERKKARKVEMVMKPILKLISTVSLALALWLPSIPHSAHAEVAATPEEWTKYPLVAHALGGIDGVDYTNSLEAFKQNYDKGQRVFEVDLSLTEDGQLAARHDWQPYLATKFEQNIPADKLDEPLTLKEFKSYKILKQYTPLSFTNIARILEKYPDVYFITDTKETDPAIIQEQFSLIKETANKVDPAILDRIIPEIYSPEMMDTVKGIINFKHVIFSIYMSPMEPDEVIQYVKDHQIHVVAMPAERATRSFMKGLAKVDAVAYVHSLNTVEEVNKYLKMGVHGVYTDFLSYRDLGMDTSAWTGPAGSKNIAASATTAGTHPQIASSPNSTELAVDHKLTAWESLKSILAEIFSI